MAKLAKQQDLPRTRDYCGEHHLCSMARAANNREDCAIVGMAVLSLGFLLRVGEAAKHCPADVRG